MLNQMINRVNNTAGVLSKGFIRLFDICFASLLLLGLAPVFGLLLLCSQITLIRQPFFFQKRLGLGQKHFTVVKLRTMVSGTLSLPTHLTNKNSLTRYGQFLRRSKLDELPQLWNVLKGDMSLVGPRPGLPNHVELTKARDKAGVFSVRPGITGLAQISGIDMSTPELLAETDAGMISDMSVRNYFKYIFLTVLGKGSGDRVKS